MTVSSGERVCLRRDREGELDAVKLLSETVRRRVRVLVGVRGAGVVVVVVDVTVVVVVVLLVVVEDVVVLVLLVVVLLAFVIAVVVVVGSAAADVAVVMAPFVVSGAVVVDSPKETAHAATQSRKTRAANSVFILLLARAIRFRGLLKSVIGFLQLTMCGRNVQKAGTNNKQQQYRREICAGRQKVVQEM